MNTVTTTNPLATFLVRHADDNIVIGQRLGEYISCAPELEEDLAIANTALDHIGVARHLYSYAGDVEGDGRSEDDFAMLRSERQFTNALLVEQPNIDFSYVIVRQFFFDAYQVPLWSSLASSSDLRLGGIAAKAHKEAVYHLRRSSSWVVRLGDGTPESERRVQGAIDTLWRFTAELCESDDVGRAAVSPLGVPGLSDLAASWDTTIDGVFERSGLARPADDFQTSGGRNGVHTEHLGKLLAEMQWMQRSYPGMTW